MFQGLKSQIYNDIDTNSLKSQKLNLDSKYNSNKSFIFKTKCKATNEYYYINIQLNENTKKIDHVQSKMKIIINNVSYDKVYKADYFYDDFPKENYLFKNCRNIKEIYNHLELLIKAKDKLQICLYKFMEKMRIKIKLISCFQKYYENEEEIEIKNMCIFELKECKIKLVENIEIRNEKNNFSYEKEESKEEEIIDIESSSFMDNVEISILDGNFKKTKNNKKKLNLDRNNNKLYDEVVDSININSESSNFDKKIKKFNKIIKEYQKEKYDLFNLTTNLDLNQNLNKINKFSPFSNNNINNFFSGKNKIMNKQKINNKIINNLKRRRSNSSKSLSYHKTKPKLEKIHFIYNEMYKSKIIKYEKEIKLIMNQINEINKEIQENEIQKIELLYRATEDGASAFMFHQKCDDVNDIILLFKTVKNVRFGAFTKRNFEPKKYSKKYDENSFLFNLNTMKIFEYVENKNVKGGINTLLNFGPCFLNNALLTGRNILNDVGKVGKKNCGYEISYDFELNLGNECFMLEELEVYQLFYEDLYILE